MIYHPLVIQACTNSAIKFVEYDKSNITVQNNNADACQNIDIVYGTPHSIDIVSPNSLKKKEARCEQLRKKLQRRTQRAQDRRIHDKEQFFTAAESCTITKDEVKLVARFNKRSFRFISLLALATNITSAQKQR